MTLNLFKRLVNCERSLTLAILIKPDSMIYFPGFLHFHPNRNIVTRWILTVPWNIYLVIFAITIYYFYKLYIRRNSWSLNILPIQWNKRQRLRKKDGGQDILKGCQKPNPRNLLKSAQAANSDVLRLTVPVAPDSVHMLQFSVCSAVNPDYKYVNKGIDGWQNNLI